VLLSGVNDSPLSRDIARQPAVFDALMARAAEFVALGADRLRPGPGGRLYVAGCGDGYFAALASRSYAVALGLDWRAIGALDLVLEAQHLSPNDRVIAVSMSGNVDRTVEAALAVAAAGVPLVALVNSAQGGRLGQVASARISLALDDMAPFLCGTASYSASVLALMALASGAAGAASMPLPGGLRAAMQAAINRSGVVLERLRLPTGVRLLSAGAERGTVAYGAAKLVELTRIPSWSVDLEEFAHSQYWSMPASDLVVIVAAHAELARYADEACSALNALGVETLAIDTAASPVPHATHRISLPLDSAVAAPLVTAIPLQLLAQSLALRCGLNPDTRVHLKSDATRFQVSRMLTRRSLLGTGA